MFSIDSHSLVSHVVGTYAPVTLGAVTGGRGGIVAVAVIVAVAAFTMLSGMAGAFSAALAAAVGVFAAMLRVAGIGLVAIVVIGLLLLL